MRYKRIAVILAAMTGCISALCANGESFIAKSKENVDMYFTITDENALTCEVGKAGGSSVAQSYNGSLTIPGTVFHPVTGREYRVTAISDDAFYECSLTSLTLPNEVTKVRGFAFMGCSKLTAFSVGNQNPIFYDKDGVLLSNDGILVCYPAGKTGTNYYVPTGISVIDDYAFADCRNLENITFQHEVGRIGSYAFSTCFNLKSINISATYGATIGNYAFYFCESMTKATLGDGFISIGNNAFSKCRNLRSVNIPNSVTKIGEYAFYECAALTKVIIPDGLKVINTFTFSDCRSMREVTLPASITTVCNFAFSNCPITLIHSNIKNPAEIQNVDSKPNIFPFDRSVGQITVYVPSDLISTYENTKYWEDCEIRGNEGTPVKEAEVGDEFSQKVAMADGKIVNLKFRVTKLGPSSEVEIVSRDGEPSSNWDLQVPETVKDNYGNTYQVVSIADDVFMDCTKMISLYIGKNINKIGSHSFRGCYKLRMINVDKGNTRYSTGGTSCCIIDKSTQTLILGCKDTKIPAGVKAIGNYAFLDCKELEKIEIPNGVTSIGDYAFARCTSLSVVVIPQSIESIGASAFFECSSITVLYSYLSEPFPLDGVFSYKIPYLFVLNGTIEQYKNTSGWDFDKIHDNLTVSKDNIYFYDGVDENSSNYKLNNCNYNNEEGCLEFSKPMSSTPGNDVRDLVTNDDFNENNSYLCLNIPENCRAIRIKGEGEVSLAVGNTSDTRIKSLNGDDQAATFGCHTDENTPVMIGRGSVSLGGSRGDRRSPSQTGILKIYSIEFLGNDDVSDDGDIIFADDAVKAICVSRWDTDGNGELSMSEAAAVTSLDGAFQYNDEIEYFDELKYFTGLPVIEDYAFWDSSLKSVMLPEGITAIGAGAFSCPLLSIVIPEGVSEIGELAFQGTYLTSIDIPEGVTKIGWGAFYNSFYLKDINIPSSVRTIGKDAFYGTCVTSFDWPENVWVIEDGAIDSYGLSLISIPASVTSIGVLNTGRDSEKTDVIIRRCIPPVISSETFRNRSESTLYVPYGSKAAYESADYWSEFKYIMEAFPGDNSVVEFNSPVIKQICIERWDSNGDEKLSKVEAAEVKEIGDAFKYIDYTTEKLSSFNELEYFIGLTSIEEGAFDGCWFISSVTIPSSVTRIENGAFSRCTYLAGITIPSNVSYIAPSAFDGNFLSSIVVEPGNTVYDSRDNCNALIETATNTLILGCDNTIIPNSVTKIGANAFQSSGKTNVFIPEGVQEIGTSAFYFSKSLTSVQIPSSVNLILGSAFAECTALTSIDIPEGVWSVENYTFWKCTSMTTINLPQTITFIGNRAFEGCDALTSVGIRRRKPFPIDENVFPNRSNATLYVPYGSKAAYEAADYWCEFGQIVENLDADDSIIEFEDIAAMIFCINSFDTNGDRKLSKEEAAAVTSLEGAFSSFDINYPDEYSNIYVSRFNELKYFTGLTAINYDDFYMWGNLKSVIIPENVVSMEQPFYNCSLENIQVDEKNTTYDSRGGCNAVIETASNTLIKGIYNSIIPESVTAIGEQAFAGLCITSMTVPQSVTSIGSYAFSSNCLETLVLPDNVMYAGYEVFSTNTPFYRSLPDGLLYIGKVAYKYKGVMSEDTHLNIRQGTTCITDMAFLDCKGLTSVNIPSTVNRIGWKAFSGCKDLRSVTIKVRKPIYISWETFSSRADATLYVPFGCKAAYENATEWRGFKEIVELSASECYDVNGDGIVNQADVDAICSYVMGITPPDFDENIADVNGDRCINAVDIVVLISILQQL